MINVSKTISSTSSTGILVEPVAKIRNWHDTFNEIAKWPFTGNVLYFVFKRVCQEQFNEYKSIKFGIVTRTQLVSILVKIFLNLALQYDVFEFK